MATSGVAASFLPGGRTVHSRFKLPLHVDDKSSGNISIQCSLAKMIVAAKLVVWDEASMANRHSIKALDESLQKLMSNDLPFGGKTVLFGGDFRQILPIVPGGSRESMIAASIVATKIWPVVTKIKLEENMRAKEDPDFVSFLMRIGNVIKY
ncbi:PREDICTED: ATP-dependent DNA helicase PIF1-like [Erythranthe guttata]|uniref:ATP-dependent DNA helicase PIF1-like n=1 Tax=Erythranthe guttata TaxID=4155 RepID=UPI00064DE012|nr:PREDICTED: ATP-dependent DNA helicase PIF1-like [Erythranthe guttata]|eukprot:XP_012846299.1 PREDICTED: ATP-dependent DNA helicase PIF1-like [Erythranthe guttata]